MKLRSDLWADHGSALVQPGEQVFQVRKRFGAVALVAESTVGAGLRGGSRLMLTVGAFHVRLLD